MRIAFILFSLLHGLIHLAGAAKAFGWSEVKQLQLPISRTAGFFWLTAALLYLAVSVFYAAKNNSCWLIAFAAVLLSQVLVFMFWSDAKFGTVANLIVLLVAIPAFGNWNYHRQFENDVKKELRQPDIYPPEMLTEYDIKELPVAVQRYIRYTGCIGKAKVNNFRIVFSGGIRKNEESAWMPFRSEQFNIMNQPARLFFMDASMKKMPVGGYHLYRNEKAMMDIRLFSLFNVQYMDGAEMNTAETVTFFNDMCCMAPATLIDKRIHWQDTSGDTVQATFTNNSITIQATLFFNSQGELIDFKSDDRYAADAGKKLPWSTPLKNYTSIGGYKLASEAEAVYTYPGGKLAYGKFKLEEIEYNCPAQKE